MGSGFNGGPQWQVDNGRAIYLVKQDTSTVANTSAGAYSADVLQHLAVSYDAANYAFYVQGSSAGSGSASTTFTSVLRQDIGGSGNSIFFKGYMSEFVVWRSILSSGTIAAIKAGYY
jgi:hypothetical protein